jgi:hypothetical protein
MMIINRKKINTFFVISLIIGQVCMISSFLLVPKQADAVLGIGDFSFDTEIGNWYDIFKEMGLAAAERIAISYANKYLTRFVDKVVDKYRIKNYQYYERVLSGYYLNQYIYENVDDPDLRAIYNILATDVNSRATVTDEQGNSMPVLAALKQKTDEFYYSLGGSGDPGIVKLPSESNYDYFARMEAYYSSPPDFTSQNLISQVGDFQNSADAAAAMEVANSQGFKNDRSNVSGVVPQVCSGWDPGPYQPEKEPRSNQANCVAAGGRWVTDAKGLAQTVIQNPSAFIHNFATAAIQDIFKNNFEPRNTIFSAIGSLLGNFLFNKLNLNSDSSGGGFDGTLNEAGTAYASDNGNIPLTKEIDIDADNIPDGQDADGDGQLTNFNDSCYHGGVPPNCSPSAQVTTSPYFTPVCQAIDRAVTTLTNFAKFIDEHADHLEGGSSLKGTIPRIMAEPIDDFSSLVLNKEGGFSLPGFGSETVDNFVNKADASIWSRNSGEANTAIDDLVNAIQAYHSSYFDSAEIAINRYAHYLSSDVQSLQKDQDLDLSGTPWGGSGGGGLKNMMTTTAYTLRYLVHIKGVIGRCDNPNLKAVEDTPAPDIVDPGTGDGNGGGSCDDDPTAQACASVDHADLVIAVENYLESRGIDMTGNCGGFEVVKRVAWALRDEGAGVMSTFHSSACSENGYSGDLVAYSDNSAVDILTLATSGTPSPHWLPNPPSTESGVNYVPPSDPGDPPGSY